MLIVGLTGGIATGKSTVSKRLREQYGAAVVDADVIAREVVEPGKPAYNAIIDYFGGITPHLVLSDGSRQLNRAALGKTVFGNDKHRKILNSIVHPAVRKAIAWEVLVYWIKGRSVVFLDVPLLFESKLDFFCGTSLAVLSSDELQYERLRMRDAQLSEQDARERIAAQMPLETKRNRADLVIENNGDLGDLYAELDRVMKNPPVSRPVWLTWIQWVLPIGLLWGLYTYWRRKPVIQAKL